MSNQALTIPSQTVTYLREFALPGAIAVAPYRITICYLTGSSALTPEDTIVSPYTSSEAVISYISEEELGKESRSRKPKLIFVHSDGWFSVVVYWRDKEIREEYWEKVVGCEEIMMAEAGLVCRKVEAEGLEELEQRLEEAKRYLY